MKRKRVIKLLLLFVVFFVAIIGIKADDDVDIKFTVKDALGSLSKISSKADYCKAAGCRIGSGTFGIRVTVVNRDGIRVKGTKTLIIYMVQVVMELVKKLKSIKPKL